MRNKTHTHEHALLLPLYTHLHMYSSTTASESWNYSRLKGMMMMMMMKHEKSYCVCTHGLPLPLVKRSAPWLYNPSSWKRCHGKVLASRVFYFFGRVPSSNVSLHRGTKMKTTLDSAFLTAPVEATKCVMGEKGVYVFGNWWRILSASFLWSPIGNDGILLHRIFKMTQKSTMRVWTFISPLWHWFFCLFSLSLRLFLCICSDSFSVSMSIMSSFLYFKGMWKDVMTFTENTQMSSLKIWHGLLNLFCFNIVE